MDSEHSIEILKEALEDFCFERIILTNTDYEKSLQRINELDEIILDIELSIDFLK